MNDTETLMREALGGDARTFAQLARLLPMGRGGRPTAPATLWRWHSAGVRMPDGRTIKLAAIRIGGRHVSSEGALRRFLAAQQDGGEATCPPQGAGHGRAVERRLDAIFGPTESA